MSFTMNVLITGASRGLGACLTKKFLSMGHRVFAGIRQSGDLRELEALKDCANLYIIPMDVSKQEDIEHAKEMVEEKTDYLDAVINSAGILLNKNGYIIEESYSNLEMTFKVNTIAPIYINNMFMDLIQRSKNAVIINIASEILSIDGVGSWFPAYCISKTAVAQYAFTLKATFEKLNIKTRVFAVHPGRMRTAMGGDNSEIEPEESAENIYKIAIGEVLPDNEEIYVNYKGEPMLSSQRGSL